MIRRIDRIAFEARMLIVVANRIDRERAIRGAAADVACDRAVRAAIDRLYADHDVGERRLH